MHSNPTVRALRAVPSLPVDDVVLDQPKHLSVVRSPSGPAPSLDTQEATALLEVAASLRAVALTLPHESSLREDLLEDADDQQLRADLRGGSTRLSPVSSDASVWRREAEVSMQAATALRELALRLPAASTLRSRMLSSAEAHLGLARGRGVGVGVGA